MASGRAGAMLTSKRKRAQDEGSGERDRANKGPRRGIRSASEVAELLSQPAGPEFVSRRDGPGGRMVEYVKGHHAVELSNYVLGYDGWSSEIGEPQLITDPSGGGGPGGKTKVFVRVRVRVVLSEHLGGVYREDDGYGDSNERDWTAAFQKAAKEAVTDGLKRALSQFGQSTGNCFKDKEYIQWSRGAVRMPPLSERYDLRRTVRVGRNMSVHEESLLPVRGVSPARRVAGPKKEDKDDFGSELDEDEFLMVGGFDG